MATPPKKPVLPAKAKAKPVPKASVAKIPTKAPAKTLPSELKPLSVTAKAEPAPEPIAPAPAPVEIMETAVILPHEPAPAPIEIPAVAAAETPISGTLAEAPVADAQYEVEETESLKYVVTPEAAPIDTAEGKKIMTEAFETGKKFATEAKEKLQAAYVDLNAKTKAAVEKSGKLVEEVNGLTRGNVEAVVESSKIAVKGFETLGQDAAEFGRRQFETTSATIKSFAAVKTPAELFQLQSDLWSSYFDSLASESAKRSETVLKLAGDIAQPISTRFAVVSDKVKSFATAA